MTSTVRFPNESAAYRAARDELLTAEAELRAQTERVAALRRQLPTGGAATDYAFTELVGGDERTVRLSELFGAHDTLFLYAFMYSPRMPEPCPLCTSFLDGLNAQAGHLTQNIAVAVAARSPIGRIRAFTDGRGWSALRLLSSAENTFHRDYHGETESGAQLPMANVFVRTDSGIHHTWGSELLYAGADQEGHDARHIDILWPLWNVLDLTPGGRGASWYPQLSYS